MNIENIERVKALMVEIDQVGAEFDMAIYRTFLKGDPALLEPITVEQSAKCGSVCCALGYMVTCIDRGLGVTWPQFFGLSSFDPNVRGPVYLFLFGRGWAHCRWLEGRGPLAVNKRLDYLVKFGVDHVAKLMMEKTVQKYEDLWLNILEGLNDE